MHTYIDALMSCSGGAPKDTARVQMNQLDGNVKHPSVGEEARLGTATTRGETNSNEIQSLKS